MESLFIRIGFQSLSVYDKYQAFLGLYCLVIDKQPIKFANEHE